MLFEWELNYCKTCDNIFKSRVSKPYYTLNHWIENQRQLIYGQNGIQFKHHKMIVPITITNCPFCRSAHNINVKKILDMFNVYTKTGKKVPYNRLYSMKQYSKYAKIHKKIVQKIGQEHLNSIKDKEETVKV